MKPEETPTPREELEMRLTALLMGELPPEEAAALEARMAAEPELAALHGRLRKAMELLREASAEPEPSAPAAPVQLSRERRERLLAHFKTPAPAAVAPAAPVPMVKKPRRDWSWAAPMGLAAALIALLGVGVLMTTGVVQKKAASTEVPDFSAASDGFSDNRSSVSTFGPGSYTFNRGKSEHTSPGYVAPSAPEIRVPGRAIKFAPAGYVVPSAPSHISMETAPSRIDSPVAAVVAPLSGTSANSILDLSGTVQGGYVPEEQKRPFGTDVNGTGGVIINGGTNLALTGSNTYTGAPAISGGSLVGSAGNNTFVGAIGNGAPSISTASTGLGSLNGQSSNGTATLNSSNAYAGAATVSVGTLSAGKDVFLGGGTMGISGNNVAFDDAPGNVTLNQSTSATPGTLSPASPAILKGLGDTGSALNTEAVADQPTSFAGGSFNFTGNTRPKDEVIRREIPVSPNDVSKTGSGTLVITGGNTFAGTTTISGGTLGLTDPGTLSIAAPSVADNITVNGTRAPEVPGLAVAQKLQNEFQRDPGSEVGKDQAANFKKQTEAKEQPPAPDKARLFIEAQGLYDTGRFDLAKKRAEQILAVDPNNVAARKFEAKIDRALSDYGVAAYNETRAAAVAKTDMAWARPTRRFNAPADPDRDGFANEDESRSGSHVKDQEMAKRLADTAALLAQIRTRNGIVDPEPDKENSNAGYQTQTRVMLQGETASQELRVLELERQSDLIGSLSPEQLQDGLKTLGVDDATVSRNLPLLQDAKAEKARLKNQGLGDDDSRIKALDAQVATYSRILADQMNTIKTTLTKRLRLEKDKLAALKTEAKNSREVESEQARMSEYLAAKNKYIQARKSLESAKSGKESNETEVDKKAEEPAKPSSSSAPIPQPEIQTSANAFSTFSLNVSDVSFKLAAASLEKGQMPDPASVRSEEFINAFDYRDPQPAPGAPLAFAAEQARYPFAQNRDLLRFSVKTAAAGRQPGRPLNIVLLLDKSGSMERADRVNIVRETLRVLATQLQAQDKLSIVTFARTPRLWADGVAGDKVGEMIGRVSEITPDGGTNLEAALDLGYATAQRHYAVGSINRVVLFTDGAANLGDVNPDALAKKVEARRKQGIALDCFGIGWEGYNDDLLEQLSHNADGRYGFINTPDEAAANFATQLAGALQVAASDVKVQVEFNPRRVTAHRQIGYAKHQLTKEQFRDNSVNAAQIGAAESGNALYVVEVNPRGEGDLATVRVRFRVPGTSDYQEHEWAVPFAGEVPPLQQASSALRLAGASGAFSEMLAANPYATEVTSDRLLGVLAGVPPIYGADPRPAKLEWMIRQAGSLSGR